MVERNWNTQPVFMGQRHRFRGETGVVHDVEMRKGCPFGVTGGATGELDVDGVVRIK